MRASGEHELSTSAPSRSPGVLAAAAALILAVWAALALSSRTEDAERARADAVPPPGDVPGFRADLAYLPDDPTLGFVEIPEGPFTMGSDPRVDRMAFDLERWSPQAFQGRVVLPAFLIAGTEVTVAQYAAFVRDSGHPVADARALRGAPDHPVTFVAWTDAVAYARWLDGRLRGGVVAGSVPDSLAALLESGWTVALPTEAQWEKAARGTDGRIWPWGDEPLGDRANFGAQSTMPVGSYACPECPWPGVADMAGNVWEWTRSPYQPYPYDPADDRSGLGAEALWVMRGGAFSDGPQHVRAANRGGADPGARRPFLGFRVALVPTGSSAPGRPEAPR